MKHGYCTTRDERRAHVAKLAESFRRWKELATSQLLAEVQQTAPNASIAGEDDAADRYSLIQYLVMEHVEKMI